MRAVGRGARWRLRQANEALRKYAEDLDYLSKVDPLMRIGTRAAFEKEAGPPIQ